MTTRLSALNFHTVAASYRCVAHASWVENVVCKENDIVLGINPFKIKVEYLVNVNFDSNVSVLRRCVGVGGGHMGSF